MLTTIKQCIRRWPWLNRRARRLYDRLMSSPALSKPHTSYAQLGEDVIIASLLKWMKVSTPRYLDIGAHSPTFLSNTYMLYRQGGSGVCVEPNPDLCAKFRSVRPRDTVVQAGITAEPAAGSATYYLMSARPLSTFSADEAHASVQKGHAIDRELMVPLIPINDILREHFDGGLDLLSLDVEGWDEAILKAIDFERDRPLVICVETVEYGGKQKTVSIIDLLLARDYRVFADTFINTIFVDQRVWDARLPDVSSTSAAESQDH